MLYLRVSYTSFLSSYYSRSLKLKSTIHPSCWKEIFQPPNLTHAFSIRGKCTNRLFRDEEKKKVYFLTCAILVDTSRNNLSMPKTKLINIDLDDGQQIKVRVIASLQYVYLINCLFAYVDVPDSPRNHTPKRKVRVNLSFFQTCLGCMNRFRLGLNEPDLQGLCQVPLVDTTFLSNFNIISISLF